MKPPFKQFPSWRPFQEETVEKVLATDKKWSIVRAPTGTGKSIQGMAICTGYPRSIYLCSSKVLQEQLRHDFGFPMVMGRNNYPCNRDKFTERMFPEITAADCIIREGKKGDRACKTFCPYEIAKVAAVHSPISILNMTYFLYETNYIGKFRGASMVVVDECDKLEEEILRFVQIEVTDKILRRLDIDPPQYKTKVESWKEWAKKYRPVVEMRALGLWRKIDAGDYDIDVIREGKALGALATKMEWFETRVDETWIYEEKPDRIKFQPIWIEDFMEETFWDKGSKFMLMSATPPIPRLIGLSDGDVNWIDVPSQFPVDNRPVIYIPAANLTRKTFDAEAPKIIPVIQSIINDHPNDKGLVHTVSYKLAKYITDHIYSQRWIMHDGKDRQAKLDEFKDSPDSLIMVSPSMERGVDLHDDLARFCIIAKIPYPSLGDKQVAARLYSSAFGQYWYRWTTACTIVQMSGRVVRSATDHATTYILDKQFEEFYAKNSEMFPPWWLEAVKISG